MAGELVVRPRPPTMRTCPPSLDHIRLSKAPTRPSTYIISIAVGPDDHLSPRTIWYALGDVFNAGTCEGNLSINLILDPVTVDTQKVLKNLLGEETDGCFTVSRSWWFQSYDTYAYGNPTTSSLIEDQEPLSATTTTEEKIQRPSQTSLPKPPSPFYERYIPHLNTYFCMSIFGNSNQDVNLLHCWLNDPRVDEYWKDSGSFDDHVKWLEDRYNDSHVLPVLGSFRDIIDNQSIFEPFAYYEIYWASEDKISSFYKTDPYDRGIHMLVGTTSPNSHRGPHKVKSWLPSLLHYIFNDQPKTKRILSEPNYKNLKMIHYLESFGFKKVDEIDVGNKIAAIMVLDRLDFWNACPL